MDQKRLIFKETINHIHTIEDEAFDLLFSKCLHTSIKKGTTILHEGDQENSLRFILKGVIKAYRIVETASDMKKEAINWIVDERNVACSVVSLFKRVRSVEYLETVEDTEFLHINYFDLRELSEINLSISTLVNRWSIEYLVMFDKRLDIFRNTKPEYRLQIFMSAQPHLLKRLSKKEIASYLDIAPGTLSRAFHKLKV